MQHSFLRYYVTAVNFIRCRDTLHVLILVSCYGRQGLNSLDAYKTLTNHRVDCSAAAPCIFKWSELPTHFSQ